MIWKKYGTENVGAIFLSLSKKRNQSKRAQTDMLKVIIEEIYPSESRQQIQESILKAVIEITEGKIYVEYEYSWAVRKLTEIYLLNGNLEEAVKLIQDIQIETFGSLSKVYKVEYILFQIKILLEKGDFIRTLIVSNKVIRKNLNDKGLEELKIQFYDLMIKYYNHEEKYFDVSMCYKSLYDYSQDLAQKIKECNSKGEAQSEECILYNKVLAILNPIDLFEKYITFLNLCPPTKEYFDAMNEIKSKYVKELDIYSYLGNIVKLKLGDDTTQVTESFLATFNKFGAFIDDKAYFNDGRLNFRLFRKYFIQHNLLLLNKFFSQISLQRISELIAIPKEEAESEICDMVNNNYMYAKINRIKAVVSFRRKKNYDDKLNSLDDDLYKMLDMLESTCHLIHKENLKYDIK